MSLNIDRTLCLVGAVLAASAAFGQAVPAGTVADVIERTSPFGALCLEGEDCGGAAVAAPPADAAGAAGKSGSDVYGTFCRACHETGLNEAPKLGDADAWAPRLAKGMEELLRTTRNGLNVMPPMGLCMSCSDDELEAAIEYMTAPAQEAQE